MSHFAIIETGGKQYRVSAGQKIKVEKLPGEEGGILALDKVILTSNDGKVAIGTPYVNGAAVEAKVLRQARSPKEIVFRYHPKTRYRKKKGHRQHFTELEIVKV